MAGPRLARVVAACIVGGTMWCGQARAEPAPLTFEPNGNPNEMLSYGPMRVPRWLAETVIKAAQVTGVDPVFVMALADKESSFSFQSRARTSSAEGLFQFIESTWLQVLAAHAAKHGFGAAADAITVVGGRPTVTDPEQRRWILGLRQDPYLSALMACEMLKDSRAKLVRETERTPSEAELYLAHFLGTNGAARLLKLVAEKPNEKAPALFPAAAKANKAIFFAKNAAKAESAGKDPSAETAKKEGKADAAKKDGKAETAKKDGAKSEAAKKVGAIVGATVAQVHARIAEMMRGRLQRYASVAAN
jgi:hypothetical protein